MTSQTSSLNDSPEALRIAFLLQAHFSLMSFCAAADALTTANLVLEQSRFQFQTLALDEKMVVSDLGISIACDQYLPVSALADESNIMRMLADVDILIVCGGYRCDLNPSPTLSRLIQTAHQQGLSLGGLWNGAIKLAQADVMQGYACALHLNDQALAETSYPDMDIRPDAVVIDRNRLSAAGPNSAFDLMLILIHRHDSADTVRQIRNILKADTSATGTLEGVLQRDKEHLFPQSLRNALHLMRSNLDEPLGKQDLAGHVNMSTRALERQFQRHLKTSPSKHYLHLRLQRANELLIQGNHAISEVGDACGFVSSAHFCRAFSKHFRCTPGSVKKSISRMLVP